ncbi:MAG: chemotaxis protein CheW [Acidaminobacteraceae bacterium]
MNSAEYVVFKLNGEYYGIDIHNVENIEKLLTITRVPYTENHIVGVVNLRGNVIPVVDLRKRFDLPAKELNDETRIIIVNVKELKVGMIVDSSSEVLKLEREEIDVAPSIRGSINVDFIREIGKSEGRIIMLIDLKKVLGIENIENE